MEELNRANISNLFAFYDSIGGCDPEIIRYEKKDDYTILASKFGVWPRVVYDIRDDAAVGKYLHTDYNEFDINQKPLIVINEKDFNQIPLLSQAGFRAVDYWLSMHLILEQEYSLLNVEMIEISMVSNKNEEMRQWVSFVSKTLFGSKRLDERIFEFILGRHVELVSMKRSGEIIGSALISYGLSKIATVLMVAIDPTFRGQGLGKQLMIYTLCRMKDKDYDACLLQSTRLGLPLYLSLGFTEDGKYLLMYKLK